MRISAIQSYGATSPVHNMNKARKNNTSNPLPEQKADSVSFQGKNAVVGGSLGTLFGLGVVTVLSGGLAPLAVGMIAGAMGASGAMLGHVADKVAEKNQSDKNSGKEG